MDEGGVMTDENQLSSAKRRAIGALLVCVAVSAAVAQHAFETKISELPFARDAEVHEIDRRCAATGRENGNIYHYAQNAAKNNFSARGGPIALTIGDFTRLQQASQKLIDTGIIVLQGKYPEDRTRLRKLIKVGRQSVGEGTLVRLQAYVFNSRYANTKFSRDSQGQPGKGEAVNCDNPELDWNDIHIALSASADPLVDECCSVTAEISPHYRPLLWSKFHDGLNEEVETVLPGLLKGKVLYRSQVGVRPLRVRLTGPLFYDASHRPCVFRRGKIMERHTPERRSIWEIHPVYRIEVYDTGQQDWLELDKWAEKK